MDVEDLGVDFLTIVGHKVRLQSHFPPGGEEALATPGLTARHAQRAALPSKCGARRSLREDQQ